MSDNVWTALEKEVEVDMTFDEAKKLYINCNCSLFVMAREEKEAYDEYRLLNISRTTEEEWRYELFLSLWEQFKNDRSGNLFNRMYNLLENRHNKKNLLIMEEALYKVNYENPKMNACISETVLGRKALSERSGMVFWAYDLGEQEIAKNLLQFVKKLLTIQIFDEKILDRFEKGMKKCDLIASELNYVIK